MEWHTEAPLEFFRKEAQVLEKADKREAFDVCLGLRDRLRRGIVAVEPGTSEELDVFVALRLPKKRVEIFGPFELDTDVSATLVPVVVVGGLEATHGIAQDRHKREDRPVVAVCGFTEGKMARQIANVALGEKVQKDVLPHAENGIIVRGVVRIMSALERGDDADRGSGVEADNAIVPAPVERAVEAGNGVVDRGPATFRDMEKKQPLWQCPTKVIAHAVGQATKSAHGVMEEGATGG